MLKRCLSQWAFVLGVSCCLGGPAWAQEPGSSDQVPPQLQSFIDSGQFSFHGSFKVSEALRGLILKRNLDYFLMYETSDGHLIDGAVIGLDGANLTAQHTQTRVPERDLDLGLEIAGAIADGNIVTEGAESSDRSIYIFVDLNCGFCYYLWLATRDYVKEYSDISLKWVPVAMLGEDSMVKASHILSAEEPLDVFSFYKKNYRRERGDTQGVQEHGQRKATENNQVMQRLGFDGTPAILFTDKSGVAREVRGMPSLAQIAEILDKPLIETSEPKLQRFKR